MSIILAVTLALPMVTFAAPDPGNNLTIEYRYAEGETANVAETVSQFGIDYRLIGQSDPVLENSLPVTRDYVYRIDGILSDADRAQVANIPGLRLDPVEVKLTRKIDFEDTLRGLPNNDVDSLEASAVYKARVDSMKTNSTAVIIEGPALTGVTFNVATWEPGFEGRLPETYDADIIVRGVEEYWETGYYIATMSYVNSVVESDLDIYIIFAEYEPINLPIEIEEIIEETNEEEEEVAVVPVTEEFFAGLDENDMELMGNQTGNPLVDIASGNVPLGNGSVKAGMSLISGLLSVIAIVFLALHVITIIINRNKKGSLSEFGVDEELATINNRRKNAFLILVCIVSALVPVVWLSLDNPSLPFVWINTWTVVVTIVFVVDAIMIAMYKLRFKAQDVENEEGIDYAS